jgi:HSP20 family protein
MTRTNVALIKHNGGIAGPGDAFRGPVAIPASDIAETGDAYYIYLDMPGARKDAISVSVVEETLSVRAPIARVYGNDTRVLYGELRSGLYERHFTLGRGIDRTNVDARYEDGVLTLRLLKTELLKPKEIEIH